MTATATAADTIFSKTSKGLLEINERAHGLPARMRRALILVDGSRDQAAISAMMPGEEMSRMLGELQSMGFIYNPVQTASRAEKVRVAATTPAPALVAIPVPTPVAITAAPAAMAETLPATATIVELTPAAPALDSALLNQVKVLMIESAQQFLGLMARPLIAEIEAVKDSASLKTAIARWNISLRQSHKAAQHADQYVLAVKTLVGI
ncbi:hypothetical protein [Silvimonas soli]|uniref:hypothetical protein n=1 Tax=Silvimonas soli TaxID=2980100 RepID=UPI0024B3326A|nr:hypothetical protein [Silvimonas soli]